MQLTIICDHRFVKVSDGSVWTTGNLGYDFLGRYLTVFDDVRVICRLVQNDSPPVGGLRASGPKVSFDRVTDFSGLLGYALRRRSVRESLQNCVRGHDPVLVRAPSVLGWLGTRCLERQGRPYALEVVGDPRESFGWGRPAGPLGVAVRSLMSWRLRRQAQRAVAVGYVPSPKLRERYPAASGATAASYSSIVLTDNAFTAGAKCYTRPPRPLHIVTVASLNWPHKGIPVLLMALRKLLDQGKTLRLTVVGEGRLRSQYIEQANSLGVEGVVNFVGQVTAGAGVRRYLREADLFVLPSLSEGLPRAMVEAMAQGLPCVGTKTGGIPALIDSTYCAETGKASHLARKIDYLGSSPRCLNEQSKRNIMRARDFDIEHTQSQAERIYRALAVSLQGA